MERQRGRRRMLLDAALSLVLKEVDAEVFASLHREVMEEASDLAPFNEDYLEDSIDEHLEESTVTSTERKLDLILEHLELSPIMFPFSEQVLDDLVLVTAISMDPPQQFTYSSVLFKRVDFWARKALSIISSFDLKNMNQYSADDLAKTLNHWSLGELSRRARSVYKRERKPSRICYPRTDQLGYVDHLVDYLKELLKAKSDLIRPLKMEILRLQQKLLHLSCRLMEVPEPRKEGADLKDLMTTITNLAYEVEYVIDSLRVKDFPIWYSVVWLQDILKELKSTERELNMEFVSLQPVVRSILNFKAIGLNIIPILNNDTEISDKLSQVFDHDDVKHYFPIRTWILVSSSYKERKKEVFLQLLQNARYASWIPDWRKVAYTSDMSEDELERSVSKLLSSFSCFIILEDVRDTDAVNALRRVLHGCRLISVLLTTPSPQLAALFRSQQDMSADYTSTSQTNKPITDVVGFKEETERMLELLIRGPTKLHIISIFGMPGQGKTTLAKKLYNDPSVVDYFDTRAWCYVSQVFEKRESLLELLYEVVQFSGTILNKTDEELAEMLYKHLKGRRFLIVLDDMWSTSAWDDLRRCFPNDNNGSRVIFTTRLQQLASQAQSGSMLQPLGLLSDDESWALLEKKLFGKDSCPPHLLGVGTEIAKSCRGLPLSVVLAAGLLVKMEERKDWWIHIAENLTSCVLGDAQAQGKSVIELSYKHLPDHLKSCFLYFGAFLEGKEVRVGKLIRLWIAEGFIKHNELKSLEDVADDYLMDLIHRSLVIVEQEKSKGGVKSCRVHDLLRDFCLTKAKEEKFLQLIHRSNELFRSSNDSYSSIPTTYNLRRLCIYSKRNHFILLKRLGPVVRSLLFFASSEMSPSDSYDISFCSHDFRLLRILDLEDINVGDAFKDIGMLVHLRYIAVQGYVDSIPSSIANLWNLETLCVKALNGKVVNVPDCIWDMTKLRHIHINDSASFDLEPHRLENSSTLDNLQTISTLSLSYGDDIEKIMRRLRGIRKLKCIFLDSWDDDKNCNKFPVLEFLSQLVSLKVFYNGEGKYPCKFNLPSNLKKLTLSNFRMPWNEISQLATLRNLEVLKLVGNAFEGEIWEMEDEMFPKLKFLKLDTLNFVKWNATSDCFPHLERLLLHKCEQLEKIPPSIGDIPTLQMIEVMWCNPSAAISAIEIQEEQLDFGNEGLKFHIHPKIWDWESPS